MATEELNRVAITFPDLSPADAVMMTHELERELLDAGVPADAIQSDRSDAEAMDLGGVLVILGGISGFELLKEAVKGAAGEAGHQAFKALSAQVRQAINGVCQRRRVSAAVTIPGERSIFGGEYMGTKPAIAAPADIGTLGVVILGASKYPHLDGYDNPAFARSAAAAETLFGRKTPVFKNPVVLNLFDQPKTPAEIIEAIDQHMAAHADMRDLLIYYCGHGSFLRDRTYFLTLTGTRRGREALTGLRLRDLRHDLEMKLLDRRLYVVLDCCYAGEAVKEFMGPSIERAVEGGVMEALPPHGWTVLTAAAPNREAIAPTGHELTMFTGALAHVLNGDEAGTGRTLSFTDIAYETDRYIQRTHGLKAVRPQCHTPRQDAGNLARVPLFAPPAPARQEHGRKAAKERKSDAVSMDRKLDLSRAWSLLGAGILVVMLVAVVWRASVQPGLVSWDVPPAVALLPSSPAPARPPELGMTVAAPPIEPVAAAREKYRGWTVTPQVGHMNWVHAVAVTPDGRRIVSGSDDKTIKVWDAESGRLLRTLEGHTDWVRAVAVTPDGRRIVSGSDDKTIKVWDAESGRLLRTIEGYTVRAVAVTPDGRRIVSGSDDGTIKQVWEAENGTIKVWDAESGRLLRTLEGHTDRVKAVAVTPDGRRIVSGSHDKTIKVWDAESGRLLRTLEGHTAWVKAVAVTPDGRRIVSGSDDNTIKVWDAESGRLLRTLEGHTERVNAVAVTPDGQRIVSGSYDKTIKVWDAESGRLLRTLEGHTERVNAVAVTPDGQRIVSGSYDKTIKVWDAESGRLLRTLEGHTERVNAVAVTPDGRRIVSGSWDNHTIEVWDAESGRLLRTLEGHTSAVTAVAVTLDGQRIVSGSGDKTIKVWDAESGRLLRTLEGHTDWVRAVAVTPDGRRIVSGSDDKTIKVWDAESGRLLRTLEGHTVEAVAVTPDGRRIVSGGDDGTIKQVWWEGGNGTIKVWDAESGRLLRTLEGHTNIVSAVAVTLDGRRIVSGSYDKTIKVWDAESGRLLRTLGHAASVTAVAVTPDGRRIVSGSDDNTIEVWDAESGRLLRTLEGHAASVTAVAVTPDGLRIVSGGKDTIRSWELETGSWIRSWTDRWMIAADGALDGDLKNFALVRGNESMPVPDDYKAAFMEQAKRSPIEQHVTEPSRR